MTPSSDDRVAREVSALRTLVLLIALVVALVFGLRALNHSGDQQRKNISACMSAQFEAGASPSAAVANCP